MAYKITVQQAKGAMKTVETAAELAGKTQQEIIDIAHKIITAAGGLAGVLTYISHEKKPEPPPPPPKPKTN